MDWKDTLLMPKSDFAMKADLIEKEVRFREFWVERDIYQKSLSKNKKNNKFILHDGPPYANGNLHVGHALNKILKDIIVRRKHFESFFSPYVPGWDTHGLPIENKMLEELKMSKDDMNPLLLRIEAEKYARRQIEIQKEQFKTMQLFTDFRETYVTLEHDYEASQLLLFKKMALEGLAYKGLKPVYWSPSSQSALAEAEVEYQEHVSPQIIVAFRISQGNNFVSKDDYLLIMTTTPWTLPANSAVAVGENFDYDVVEANSKRYVIASSLVNEVANLSKWEEFKIIKTIKGQDLNGVKYFRPLRRNVESPVVMGHHVTIDSGTGLVHMAPLFGEDDYIIGKENNLEMIMHVDASGHLNKEAGEFESFFYQDANKNIGNLLDNYGELLSLKFIKHSYPHDWRTHKPVIYRGVPQWFVNIKKIKKDILKSLEQVASYPTWGTSRIAKMIENRNEWTISRQRTWGVPIIVFYDTNNNPQIIEELFDYVIDLVKKEGTNVWWERQTDDLLPEKYRNKNWTREMDILDVWFDSGSSSIAVKPAGEEAPFDLYLEGSDQYRGWFNSSLINSVIYRSVSPFKELLSHGFVLDEKQQKMSKSKGNVVDPLEIISKNGADILRLWVANSEYTSDITISKDIINQNIEVYRRIRNTFKFMLGNLFDFDYVKDKVELKGIHKYIEVLISNYEFDVDLMYKEYRFLDIVKETNKLFVDLSSWYFDYAKDILYCNKFDSLERRSIQTNIFRVIEKSLFALAPIIPTTSEEVYSFWQKSSKEESLFLERKETFEQKNELPLLESKFFNEHRNQANAVLEKARREQIIKRNNEAILIVNIPSEERIASAEDYAKFFMVSKVEFGDIFDVKTYKSSKCQRCWNHFLPAELSLEEICQRCQEVIKNK